MATTARSPLLNSTIVRSYNERPSPVNVRDTGQGRVSTAAAQVALRVLYGVAAGFVVRGLFILPQVLGYNIFATQPVSTHDLVFSAIALVMGVAGLGSLFVMDKIGK